MISAHYHRLPSNAEMLFFCFVVLFSELILNKVLLTYLSVTKHVNHRLTILMYRWFKGGNNPQKTIRNRNRQQLSRKEQNVMSNSFRLCVFLCCQRLRCRWFSLIVIFGEAKTKKKTSFFFVFFFHCRRLALGVNLRKKKKKKKKKKLRQLK